MARLAGFALFPWQQQVLDAACEVDALERFTRTRVTVICPRRNGKTQLVLARVLAECLLWSSDDHPAVVLYTAHLGDTARHVFTTFLDLLGRSKWLQGQVRRVGYGKGDEAVYFKNGAKFHIRARTNAGGRGLECSTLILDEALELKDDHMSALTPLLAKAQARGSGQMWMVSSAGYGRSVVLAAARDRGREGDDPTSAYFEWSAPRDADPADPRTWAVANPSLGTAILDARFLRSQFDAMSLEAFGREHLGWWTDQVADPFLPHGSWTACEATPPPLPADCRITFGVELADHGKVGTLSAAVDLTDGRVWVETLRRWAAPAGLDIAEVADDIAQVAVEHGAGNVSGDDFTTGPLLDHLEHRGIPVCRLNFTDVREASQTLLQAVTSGRASHPFDPQTSVEMTNAGRLATGDGLYRLSRKHSTGLCPAAFSTAAALHAILGPRPDAPAVL